MGGTRSGSWKEAFLDVGSLAPIRGLLEASGQLLASRRLPKETSFFGRLANLLDLSGAPW
jgi:hypothetical protein